MSKNNSDKNLLKGIIAGAVAGIAATFVMSQFQNLTSYLSDSGDSSGGKDEPATVKAAEALSEKILGHELVENEKQTAGVAMHYVMGGVSGAIYGATTEYTDFTKMGFGLPFGSAVWAIADDFIVPALGFSKSPLEYPLSTHAYALSSHMVYGATSEFVRNAVRKAL